jgi:LCP family protein required for cell wall assembly
MSGHRWLLGLVLLLALVGLPRAVAQPAELSIVAVGDAKTVDFEDGVVWFLLIGSDARPGVDVLTGNADAIQLVGIDFDSGAAAAIGVPRDTWLEVEGHGMERINATLALGGTRLLQETVSRLVGIQPSYVLTAGLTGFEAMVDSIGGVRVRAAEGFTDTEHGIAIQPGVNELDGADAVRFARARKGLRAGDFARSANHQELLRAILRQLRGQEDRLGFMEGGALSALEGLDTNLSPTALYKLAQAVTQVRLQDVTTCVLTGTPLTTADGAEVIEVDSARARSVGGDARDDARIDGDC